MPRLAIAACFSPAMSSLKSRGLTRMTTLSLRPAGMEEPPRGSDPRPHHEQRGMALKILNRCRTEQAASLRRARTQGLGITPPAVSK
jgi:hypothetical protein